MPESIRNAIVVAFVAVLVAMVCVGLLLWRGRPASTSRSAPGLPLLVTDRDGGVSDIDDKVNKMHDRLGETQALLQRLLKLVQAQADGADRARLTSRLALLEKEVRSLRKRVEENAQQQAPKPPPEQTTPALPAAPATTTTPPVDTPAGPPP